MHAARPEHLWLFALAPILALLAWARIRRASRMLAYFARKPDASVRRTLAMTAVESALLVAAAAFLAASASGASWGSSYAAEERSGLDVALCFDISNSMRAEDEDPNRLAVAVADARRLMEALPTARFAITAFKGGGAELVPLTEDPEELSLALDALDPSIMSAPGTNVEAGIDASLVAFPEDSGAHRAIVLFSDGEQLEGSAARAASKAKAEAVPIHCVGLGKTSGAHVPRQGGGSLVDDTGRQITSSLDEETLSSIAVASGGSFARRSERAIDEIARELALKVMPGRSLVWKERPNDFGPTWALCAFACLAASLFLATLSGRRR
jgi:Ca-activated chloride channel family protein